MDRGRQRDHGVGVVGLFGAPFCQCPLGSGQLAELN